ncbi:endonuclease domain-containing protein [Glaciihabitans sp. dw_435]|uniref:endonuclease domain-containing protein n=1 Tax=Glaciihabitans sp. dw_435 TaxID=2720081 RepID=UPI001BD22952|nr:DUF559 domain-containing protein [Glaciihabitans sp. dw_435]
MPANAFFCSITAAQVMALPLPLWLQNSAELHVAVPSSTRAVKRVGIVGHAVKLVGGDVRSWDGLPISSPERVWCELGQVLPLAELVAVGDRLIHWRHPLTSVSSLRNMVRKFAGRRGARTLSFASTLLHNRSESPRESILRVILVLAGVEGFEVNFTVQVPGAAYRLDFAFPAVKVFLEYQGEYHFTVEQRRADMSRRSRLEAIGWYGIEINSHDLRDPGELVDRIRRVLLRRSS